jgi:predicted metal-dependent phosphoesterase TrpH
MDKLLKVEFHCHTHYSRDSLTQVDRLVATAHQRGVDRLVITDHNTIQGAIKAHGLDPELVIVGEELLTTRGELLVAFVQEELPRGLEPMAAIEKLRAQGAFISVSHPFDRRRHGWALEDLLAIAPYVDAIEVFNARCQWSGLNQMAADFAREHQLPGTAGSDAHTLREVGRATFQVPAFRTADELRSVILQATIVGELSSPFIHFSSTYARIYKMLKGSYENFSDQSH